MPGAAAMRDHGRRTCQGAGSGESRGRNVTDIAATCEALRRHTWSRRWGETALRTHPPRHLWTLGIIAHRMRLGWRIARGP